VQRCGAALACHHGRRAQHREWHSRLPQPCRLLLARPQASPARRICGQRVAKEALLVALAARLDAVRERSAQSGHDALARLDQAQLLLHIITQNVDGLHQQAGAARVLELHGSAHAVRCLSCGARYSRQHVQSQLTALNWWWLRKTREEQRKAELRAELALLPEDEGAFRVPPCGACGGVLKTDVTFFGDSLPSSFKAHTLKLAREADGVLVAGTSLMVLSAFRLVEAAAAKGAPIAVVNLGQTRLEKEGVPHLKVEAPCGATLSRLADDLLAERAA